MMIPYHIFILSYFRRAEQLTQEENLSKETFFERCMHDPSIRDRLPILTRSLDLNRKVCAGILADNIHSQVFIAEIFG